MSNPFWQEDEKNVFWRDEDAVPSYEESVRRDPVAPTQSSALSSLSPRTLHTQLSNVRTNRIKSIIDSYIDPLLQAQASAGLLKTTLVLVPSTCNSLQTSADSSFSRDILEGTGDALSHDSQEAVVGFPSDEYVKLVRLHGHEYNQEFWNQGPVVKELDSALKARLSASGHRIAEDLPASTSGTVVTTPASPSTGASRSVFRRKESDRAEQTPWQGRPELANVGWRAEQKTQVDAGQVDVKVSLKEVVLRVLSEMGLYETRTGNAVVVHIEFGT